MPKGQNLPIYCITFDDLEKKVVNNRDLTNDDICKNNVENMEQECKRSKGNLLNLAIQTLNLNNVNKLIKYIDPDKCPINCYRSLFYHSNPKTKEDSKKVSAIVKILCDRYTKYYYNKQLLSAISINECFKEGVQILLDDMKKTEEILTKKKNY